MNQNVKRGNIRMPKDILLPLVVVNVHVLYIFIISCTLLLGHLCMCSKSKGGGKWGCFN